MRKTALGILVPAAIFTIGLFASGTLPFDVNKVVPLAIFMIAFAFWIGRHFPTKKDDRANRVDLRGERGE